MSLIIIFPHFYNSVANHGAVAVVDATLVTQTATKLWKAVADTYIFALMPFI